jgi:type VI secretion system protein ImpA
MIDIDALISETPELPPCGPDLSLVYDEQYTGLDIAARGKAEMVLGDTVIPAEPPDWHTIGSMAQQVLMRTKDLRVAVLLVRALLNSDGFSGLAQGLSLVSRLLDRYWNWLHPLLDEEDDNDPTMRLNALVPLADPRGMLADLRSSLVVSKGAHAGVTVRDLLVASGRMPPAYGDAQPSMAMVKSMIMDASEQRANQIAILRDCTSALGAIERIVNAHVGSDRAPDLRPLKEVLAFTAETMESAQAEGSGTAPIGVEKNAEDRPLQSAPAAYAISPGIHSRDDAIRRMEEICIFLERSEPGNPAPLLIRRAQRLMNKSFLEIINDLTPEGLTQIKNIAGIKDE